MNLTEFDYIFIAVIVLVVLINFWIVWSFISSAIRKYVKPELQQQGLTYMRYKWVGLFGTGDFNKTIWPIGFIIGNSSPFLSLYFYIYYEDRGMEKRMTIRIDKFMFFIRKVIYSDNFKTLKEQ